MASGSSYGLENLCRSAGRSAQLDNVLIIADQFEELFRYKTDNGIAAFNETGLFVKMLTDISRSKQE